MRAIDCPACNTKLRAGRSRCPRCDYRFGDGEAPTSALEAGRTRLSMVAGGLLFLVAAGGTAVMLVGGDKSSSRATAVPAARREAARVAPSEPAAQDRSVPAAGPALPFLDPDRAGNLSYATGNLEAALSQYREALKRNPGDAESLSNLAQVLVKLDRAAEAVPLLEQACALAPSRWAYRFNLARAVGRLGQWDRAVTEYRAAADLFPDDYATRFNLAQALHKKGDDASAVVEYHKAIVLAPDDATFHLALGVSYERLQRPAEAAGAYTKYVELSADSADIAPVKARIAALRDASVRAGQADPAQPGR